MFRYNFKIIIFLFLFWFLILSFLNKSEAIEFQFGYTKMKLSKKIVMTKIKKKKYNEFITKRERKDSVWVYNIFSTRSSFFYNKYYELILSTWIWWDKKFDFPCGVFKKYQRKWDFSTQSMIKGESKRNKVSTVWRRGRSGSTWSQWRSSNDFSFWIQFNCVRSIQACPTITSRSWERGKKPFPCKNCLSQVKNAAVELFLKVRRLKAKKMGQNSMKGRVNIQKKNKLLRRAWYYSDAAVFFWLSTAQPVSRTVPPILLGGQ